MTYHTEEHFTIKKDGIFVDILLLSLTLFFTYYRVKVNVVDDNKDKSRLLQYSDLTYRDKNKAAESYNFNVEYCKDHYL